MQLLGSTTSPLPAPSYRSHRCVPLSRRRGRRRRETNHDTPDGKSIAIDTFSAVEKGPYLALETDNIEKEVARLRKKGVPVTLDITDNKVCKMAIIQDPSGHSLMLHQMAPDRVAALAASRLASKPAASRKAKPTRTVAAKSKSEPTAKPRPKAATSRTIRANAKPTAQSSARARTKSQPVTRRRG